MRTAAIAALASPATLALLIACQPESNPAGVRLQGLRASWHEADDLPRFSDWSTPVNLGPPVNTAFIEQAASLSRDGLSLYFHCGNCPGSIGGADIYVSQRAHAADPWGAPQNLGPTINTTANNILLMILNRSAKPHRITAPVGHGCEQRQGIERRCRRRSRRAGAIQERLEERGAPGRRAGRVRGDPPDPRPSGKRRGVAQIADVPAVAEIGEIEERPGRRRTRGIHVGLGRTGEEGD